MRSITPSHKYDVVLGSPALINNTLVYLFWYFSLFLSLLSVFLFLSLPSFTFLFLSFFLSLCLSDFHLLSPFTLSNSVFQQMCICWRLWLKSIDIKVQMTLDLCWDVLEGECKPIPALHWESALQPIPGHQPEHDSPIERVLPSIPSHQQEHVPPLQWVPPPIPGMGAGWQKQRPGCAGGDVDREQQPILPSRSPLIWDSRVVPFDPFSDRVSGSVLLLYHAVGPGGKLLPDMRHRPLPGESQRHQYPHRQPVCIRYHHVCLLPPLYCHLHPHGPLGVRVCALQVGALHSVCVRSEEHTSELQSR